MLLVNILVMNCFGKSFIYTLSLSSETYIYSYWKEIQWILKINDLVS